MFNFVICNVIIFIVILFSVYEASVIQKLISISHNFPGGQVVKDNSTSCLHPKVQTGSDLYSSKKWFPILGLKQQLSESPGHNQLKGIKGKEEMNDKQFKFKGITCKLQTSHRSHSCIKGLGSSLTVWQVFQFQP